MPTDALSITTRLTPMTPYTVYLMQARDVSGGIRADVAGKEFYPAQMGGLMGQAQLLASATVVNASEFSA